MSMFGTMVPGSNDSVLALLNMMSDPEAFKEKLKQLTDLQKDLDTKIALAGEADEILNLKKSMQEQHEKMIEAQKANEEKCASLLENAKDKANALLADAEKTVERIIAEGVAVKNKAIQEAAEIVQVSKNESKSRESELDVRESELAVGEKKLADHRKKLQIDEDACIFKQQALDKLAAEMSQQKNTLNSELAQVREAKGRINELLVEFRDELDYLVIK